jgi:hypothetical protein
MKKTQKRTPSKQKVGELSVTCFQLVVQIRPPLRPQVYVVQVKHGLPKIPKKKTTPERNPKYVKQKVGKLSVTCF